MTARMRVLLALFGFAVVCALGIQVVIERLRESQAEEDSGVAAVPSTGVAVSIAQRAPHDLRPSSISGTAREYSGTPVTDARICVRSAVRRQCTTTDSNGSYRITGLPSDYYRILASAPGHSVEYLHPVILAADDDRTNIDMRFSAVTSVIRGEARDHVTGLPIASASVDIGDAMLNTDASGAFTIPVRWSGEQLYVHVTADGYAASGQTIRDGEVVWLRKGMTVSGRVIDARNGAAVAGAWITEGVQSDNAGRFTLHGVNAGPYSIRISGDWWGGSNLHVQAGVDLDDVIVRARPTVQLEGRLVYADTNEPCARGHVTARLWQGSVGSEWRSLGGSAAVKDGRVTIPGLSVGDYTIEAYCEPGFARPQPLIRVGLDDQAGFIWKVPRDAAPYVPPPRSVEGRVTSASGTPLENARIHFATGTNSRETVSNREGRYDLMLAPGTYQVQATGPTGVTSDAEAVTVGATVLEKNFVLPPGGSVDGVVLDTNKTPLAGIAIVATHTGSTRGSNYGAITDAAGHYHIAAMEPGEYGIGAQVNSSLLLRTLPRQPASGVPVTIKRAELTHLDFLGEADTATIEGVVSDESGHPIPRAAVIRASGEMPANSNAPLRTFTDVNGRFSLAGLPNGTHALFAQIGASSGKVRTDIASGSKDVVLTVNSSQGKAALHGRVALTSGLAPAYVQIRIEDDIGVDRTGVFPLTSGYFAFTDLPSSSYRITASTANSPQVTRIQALSPGSNSAVLSIRDRVDVTGRVVDAETKLPVAGLRIVTAVAPLPNTGSQAVTDADGRFLLTSLPVGLLALSFMTPAASAVTARAHLTENAELVDLGDIHAPSSAPTALVPKAAIDVAQTEDHP